jgi:hypothetical protein
MKNEKATAMPGIKEYAGPSGTVVSEKDAHRPSGGSRKTRKDLKCTPASGREDSSMPSTGP